MSEFIAGFAFTGYRSFWGGLQYLGPLAKVNLIAGQNNSGKSNVLRFAQEFLKAQNPPQALDVPRGEGVSTKYEFAVAQKIDEVLLRCEELAGGQHVSM